MGTARIVSASASSASVGHDDQAVLRLERLLLLGRLGCLHHRHRDRPVGRPAVQALGTLDHAGHPHRGVPRRHPGGLRQHHRRPVHQADRRCDPRRRPAAAARPAVHVPAHGGRRAGPQARLRHRHGVHQLPAGAVAVRQRARRARLDRRADPGHLLRPVHRGPSRQGVRARGQRASHGRRRSDDRHPARRAERVPHRLDVRPVPELDVLHLVPDVADTWSNASATASRPRSARCSRCGWPVGDPVARSHAAAAAAWTPSPSRRAAGAAAAGAASRLRQADRVRKESWHEAPRLVFSVVSAVLLVYGLSDEVHKYSRATRTRCSATRTSSLNDGATVLIAGGLLALARRSCGSWRCEGSMAISSSQQPRGRSRRM